MADYSNISFKNNGKLKLLIIVGTRPEIIRLAAVINKTRKYFDVILAHTGQNYDYNLNGVFFHDLQLADPEVYMNAVGADLGETMGNIISESYKLMVAIQPDAVLVLGDTNSCLSVIGAKRLHIPIFHMEAGNRCKDECLPEETNRRIVDIISDVNMAYSEHARRYLADTGLPKERTYVTGSPMAEVLHQNLDKIEASDIHTRLGLEKGKYILLSAHREENIDTEKNFTSLFTAINKMAEKYDMPILYSCHPRSRKRLEQSGFQLDKRVIQHEPLEKAVKSYEKHEKDADRFIALIGMDYVLVGDYYVPDLKLPEERRPIGHWGRLHQSYLKLHRPMLYNELILSGRLHTVVADLNEQAADRLDLIIRQMMKAEGVTEAMKAENQMLWVQSMNSIRCRAEEIIKTELIYC